MCIDLSNPVQQALQAGDDLTGDAACKLLFAQKSLLGWILADCVEEYAGLSPEEIAEKYIEQPQVSSIDVSKDATNPSIMQELSNESQMLTEDTVVYDVCFRAIAPKTGTKQWIDFIIHVEAQKDFVPGYALLSKAVYDCSCLISAQDESVFCGTDYDKIRKAYSIWVCLNPSKEWKNCVNRYRATEEKFCNHNSMPRESYDLQTVVLICLGEPDETQGKSMLNLLDTIFRSPKDTNRLEVLHEKYGVSANSELGQAVSNMCNFMEGYIDIGREEGIEKGIGIGVEKGLLKSIQSLCSKGFSTEEAFDLLSIPKDSQSHYLELLEAAN